MLINILSLVCQLADINEFNRKLDIIFMFYMLNLHEIYTHINKGFFALKMITMAEDRDLYK